MERCLVRNCLKDVPGGLMEKKRKTCSKCSEEKSVNLFYKNKSKKDGLSCYCKDCQNLSHKKYFDVSKAKVNETRRKSYHNKDLEMVNSDRRNYYNSNKEMINETRRKRSQERRDSDDHYRFLVNLRNRFKAALKNSQKKGSIIDYIGCSVEDLVLWIESQFYDHPKTGERMTWENHGIIGWHIDHIIPVSSMKSQEEREIKKIFHWFNLRPLWKEENLRRSRKVEKLMFPED
jgi:hypothetical protein